MGITANDAESVSRCQESIVEGNSHSDDSEQEYLKSRKSQVTGSQVPSSVSSSAENSSDLTENKSAAPVEEGYLTRIKHTSGLDDPNSPRGKLVWRNVIIFTYLHLLVLYGVFMLITGKIMWQTLLFAAFLHLCGGLGITAGAHRCYSHKSYKARFPLKIMLTVFQTIAFQNSIWEWVRDHRVHHKYSETNADPHNAKRGFFFAHIGWLLCKKHELVREKGKALDMSDIESDAVLMFQKKYHTPLGLLACFVLPAVIPHWLWGESYFNAFVIAGVCRYAWTLHITWLVNSAAHMWGSKPYDKSINPSENKAVAWFAFGEGWHNYHHVFPWDYKTAELGQYRWNLTTAFVDLMAAIGWAYDLKTIPKNIVEQRVKRTGDGSWNNHHDHHHHENAPWGWGDKDIPADDAKITQTLYANKAKSG